MEIKKTHIGVYGVIIKDEKIALIKKARGGYLGKLDLPGGGIEHEETIIEALKREIQEETETNVTSQQLLEVFSTNIKWEMEKDLFEDLHHIGIIYQVDIDTEKLKEIPDGLDSLGANWYLIKNLGQEELTPFALYSLQKLGYKIS